MVSERGTGARGGAAAAETAEWNSARARDMSADGPAPRALSSFSPAIDNSRHNNVIIRRELTDEPQSCVRVCV